MVSSKLFIQAMAEHGFGPYIGVPCSFLKPFINYVIEHPELDYIPATNEGEAIAVAAGAYLAGRRPVVMFQNSGLGNAVNPLSSLCYIFRIPLLLICTWRGEPGLKDEPQHALMGQITAKLFDLLRIRSSLFPECDDRIVTAIEGAEAHMEDTGLPFAFIMRKGTVDPYPLRRNGEQRRRRTPGTLLEPEAEGPERPFRAEAIAMVAESFEDRALLVATTGKTGRELFTWGDRPTHLYVVGSMGCASSLGLGVALYQTAWPVIVLDGDGAALMRMEAMASIGHHRPRHLTHIILDNEVCDSTGGQETISPSIDFPRVAVACGYATARTVTTLTGFQAALRQTARNREGPHLIHIKLRRGTDPTLGRPTVTPAEVAARFRTTVLGKSHVEA